MTLISSTRPINACGIIMDALANIYAKPSLNIRRRPLYDLWINQPSELRSRIQAQIDRLTAIETTNNEIIGKGPVQKFTIKYKSPVACEINPDIECDSVLDFCSSIPSQAPEDDLYSEVFLDCVLTDYVKICFYLIERYCENSYDETLEQELVRMLEKWYNKMETIILDILLGFAGNYSNGTNSMLSPLDVPLVNTNGGLNPGAVGFIKAQFSHLGIAPEDVVIVADNHYIGTAIYAPIGGFGLNAQGANTGVIPQLYNIIGSDKVNQVFNGGTANTIVAFPKEHFAIFNKPNNQNTYMAKGNFEYRGDRINLSVPERESTVKPLGGMMVDMHSEYTCDCDDPFTGAKSGGIAYAWQTPLGLFMPPVDAYCPDALGGYSYPILVFNGTCGDFDACSVIAAGGGVNNPPK